MSLTCASPSTAINYNDNLGGGNSVHDNLIFNSCRESGDHGITGLTRIALTIEGPINSWDRMPFLTDVLGKPSYDPLPNVSKLGLSSYLCAFRSFTPTTSLQTTVSSHRRFANSLQYQEAPRLLTTTTVGLGMTFIILMMFLGSSFFHISKNVFYQSDGFKVISYLKPAIHSCQMDYGGSNSRFESNLVIVLPYDGQNCLNVAPFLEDQGDVYINNTCVLTGCRSPSCDDLVTHVSQCDSRYMLTKDNHYYSPHGNATVQCGRDTYSLPDAQKKFGVEEGSTFGHLPTTAQMLSWAKELLDM